jgi:hypothetical protein
MAEEAEKGRGLDRQPREMARPSDVRPPTAPPASAPTWVAPPSLKRAPVIPGVTRPVQPAIGSQPAAGFAQPTGAPARARPSPEPVEPRLDKFAASLAVDEESTDAREPHLELLSTRTETPLTSAGVPSRSRASERSHDETRRPRLRWIALAALIVVAAAGLWLWRQGRLEPMLSPVRSLVAKIESMVPGSGAKTGASSATTMAKDAAPTTAPVDAATILEIKQLLAKLELGPGPMDGTLDPTTQAAIRTYQQMAGVPVNGQPSQALLRDLRAVVADQAKGS